MLEELSKITVEAVTNTGMTVQGVGFVQRLCRVTAVSESQSECLLFQ